MKTYTGRIKFKNGEDVLEGIVNGDQFQVDSVVYVPVHIPATNQNMVVDSRNITAEDTE